MIINAADLIMGRLASHVAQKALAGEQVTLINCEKVVIAATQL